MVRGNFAAATACTVLACAVLFTQTVCARAKGMAHDEAHQSRPQMPANANNFNQCSKQVNIAAELQNNPDVQRINKSIADKFNQALNAVKNSPPKDPYHQQLLLGTLLLHDKTLSVEKNEACTSCHTEDTGFTNGVSLFNQTVVAFPSSVKVTNPQTQGSTYRIESRKPMPYVYAPYSPSFHYNMIKKQFSGGNFWDMRATGDRSGNPSISQAEGPPIDPTEMGFSDNACVVYRMSQAPYRNFFEQVWGKNSFNIKWPSDVEKVCSTPATSSALPPPHNKPTVQLSVADRETVNITYTHFATSIMHEEASPDESPFTSKFDAVMAGKAKFTPSEEAGWKLFNGKAMCNHCHESSSFTGQHTTDGTPPVRPAMFTDWSAHNIGVPKNLELRYYCEDKPDQYGYVVNPKGLSFTDIGLGDFLDGKKGLLPNDAWSQLESQNKGKFMTPTLRDVDLRPYPTFVKAYFHNGYAKSLKEVVHFYNTSQKYPHCPQGSPGEKKTCWPPPATTANLETKYVGNLGLSDKEENEVVDFLKTLTDRYFTTPESSDYVHPPSGNSAGVHKPNMNHHAVMAAAKKQAIRK